jgi:hypothetical protein
LKTNNRRGHKLADQVTASNVRALSAWELRLYQFIKALYAVLGWIVTTMALLTFSGVIRHQLMQD